MSPRFTIRGWMLACVLVGLVLTRCEGWHDERRIAVEFIVHEELRYCVVAGAWDDVVCFSVWKQWKTDYGAHCLTTVWRAGPIIFIGDR